MVRSRWRQADPNEGFVAQLGLFHDMRCSLDPGHPVYRLWCLQQVTTTTSRAGARKMRRPSVRRMLP